MTNHTVHRLAAALIVAGGAVTALTMGRAEATPAACNTSDSAIYTPPPSVSGAPGRLLACEPVTLSLVPGNIPMKAWKVQYVSTNVHGTPIAVSGTVAVPTAAWTGPGPRPVIAFNPGTLGLGPQCAFSKQLAGAFQDITRIGINVKTSATIGQQSGEEVWNHVIKFA